MWNASKLSSHEEIARGSVLLPSRERQGDAAWNQRVQVTAAPSANRKASVSRGEVGLRLQYTSLRVRSSACPDPVFSDHITNVQGDKRACEPLNRV